MRNNFHLRDLFTYMEATLEWISRAKEPGMPACTLLVPVRLEPYLRRRKRKQGGVVRYLQNLLLKAAVFRAAGLLPKVERTTRYYQRSGQGLEKWHVRIPAPTWTELRCLAGSCGVTMTHMFVILMEIEKSGKIKSTEDPPTYRLKNLGFWEARVEENHRTERHAILTLERGPPDRG